MPLAAAPSSTEFAPAKINLFLAVTGRRADGYHDLVSVAAPLAFGDTLRADWDGAPDFSLEMTFAAEGGGLGESGDGTVGTGGGAQPAGSPRPGGSPADIPGGGDNLVIRAARAFAAEVGAPADPISGRFVLDKRIPAGAGLGGGSSDAVAALRLLNARAPRPLSPERLAAVAARIGSDCPLFLAGGGPVVMRGRGERIAPVPAAAAARLSGRRVLVFKPAFGVPTAWAYARLAARAPAAYVPPGEAEARLAAWLGNPAAPAEDLLFNSLEGVVFAKHAALPTLVRELAREFGLAVRMSGSGSACFALLRGAAPAGPVAAAIRRAWGPSAFVLDTRIA